MLTSVILFHVEIHGDHTYLRAHTCNVYTRSTLYFYILRYVVCFRESGVYVDVNLGVCHSGINCVGSFVTRATRAILFAL